MANKIKSDLNIIWTLKNLIRWMIKTWRHVFYCAISKAHLVKMLNS
jgi:hypothetical protein